MYFWLIPLIIGFIAFIVFIIFRVKERRKEAVIIKGFVSLMFIVTALVCWLLSPVNTHGTFGIFILLGLFFGLLGDVFLDLKYIVFKKEFLFTVLGFIAFAEGHIFYIIGLFVYFYNFNAHILYLLIPLIIAAILAAVTVLMEKFTPIRYNKMKPYVIIYGFILFLVTSLYISSAIQAEWNIVTLNIMAVSFILFAASDLILNNTYFATGFDGPLFIITNHALYYIAQFLIAVSLFFLI